MLLTPITDGRVSGIGTLIMSTGVLGGVMITADGTNDAVVVIRNNGPDGRKIFHLSTKNSIFVGAPIACCKEVYYDISGTGASAQIYGFSR